MDNIDFLLEMGFPREKVEAAVKKANNDIQQATEMLIAEAEAESGPSTSGTQNAEKDKTNEETEAAAENAVAKSIKCADFSCGKLFTTNEEVEFHAVKSGHSNFEESTEEKKPLTDEEKKQKVKELEERLRKRRLEKEEIERKEAFDREKKRIQMSKDITEIKRKTEEEEIKRLVDERKREKVEEKLARERVKKQIEMDREARRQKAAGVQNKPAEPPVQKPAPVASAPKSYDTTRLQIRLPTGTPLIQQFQSKEPLAAVRLWVSLNRNDGKDSSADFQFCTNFPKKIFTSEDMETPLQSLGLVPSATLMVINK